MPNHHFPTLGDIPEQWLESYININVVSNKANIELQNITYYFSIILNPYQAAANME